MSEIEKVFQVAEVKVQYIPKKKLGPKIKTANEAVDILKNFYDLNSINLQEEFLILYLNRGHRLIGVYKISKGSINSTLVDVRLVMSVGLKLACSSIILSHNHPSGNIKPSIGDIKITRKLYNAGALLDINIIDHVIVSPDFGYYSFSENNVMDTVIL
jgi:DNA repair protein RadC